MFWVQSRSFPPFNEIGIWWFLFEVIELFTGNNKVYSISPASTSICCRCVLVSGYYRCTGSKYIILFENISLQPDDVNL